MITKDALKEIEVAEWDKAQRLKALELLKLVKNNPTEQSKVPIRLNKKTVVFRIVRNGKG